MGVALIAGVGPGTGAALARAFARASYAIGLLSRRAESSNPLAKEIAFSGGQALAFQPTSPIAKCVVGGSADSKNVGPDHRPCSRPNRHTKAE